MSTPTGKPRTGAFFAGPPELDVCGNASATPAPVSAAVGSVVVIVRLRAWKRKQTVAAMPPHCGLLGQSKTTSSKTGCTPVQPYVAPNAVNPGTQSKTLPEV